MLISLIPFRSNELEELRTEIVLRRKWGKNASEKIGIRKWNIGKEGFKKEDQELGNKDEG